MSDWPRTRWFSISRACPSRSVAPASVSTATNARIGGGRVRQQMPNTTGTASRTPTPSQVAHPPSAQPDARFRSVQLAAQSTYSVKTPRRIAGRYRAPVSANAQASANRKSVAGTSTTGTSEPRPGIAGVRASNTNSERQRSLNSSPVRHRQEQGETQADQDARRPGQPAQVDRPARRSAQTNSRITPNETKQSRPRVWKNGEGETRTRANAHGVGRGQRETPIGR